MDTGINTVTINNEFVTEISFDKIIEILKSIRHDNIAIMECTIYPDDARKILRKRRNYGEYHKVDNAAKYNQNPIVLTRNGDVVDNIEKLYDCISVNKPIKSEVIFNHKKETFVDDSMRSMFEVLCDKRIIMVIKRLLNYMSYGADDMDSCIEFIKEKIDTFGEFCREIILQNYYPGTSLAYCSSFLAASYVAYDTGKVTLKDIRNAQLALHDCRNNMIEDGKEFGIRKLFIYVYFNIRKYGLAKLENNDALFWDTLLAYYCFLENKEYKCCRSVLFIAQVRKYFDDFSYDGHHIVNKNWEYRE